MKSRGNSSRNLIRTDDGPDPLLADERSDADVEDLIRSRDPRIPHGSLEPIGGCAHVELDVEQFLFVDVALTEGGDDGVVDVQAAKLRLTCHVEEDVPALAVGFSCDADVADDSGGVALLHGHGGIVDQPQRQRNQVDAEHSADRFKVAVRHAEEERSRLTGL